MRPSGRPFRWGWSSSLAPVRRRLRLGVDGLRGGWWQILQTALAAGIAWFLALPILQNERPSFAPIAAVVSLGLAAGERGRRVVELPIGVAFGVAIGDLLVSLVGVGAVQSAVLVALAMVVAVFLGRGELGVNDAAISAMIIMITFQPWGTGFPLERFLERRPSTFPSYATGAP